MKIELPQHQPPVGRGEESGRSATADGPRDPAADRLDELKRAGRMFESLLFREVIRSMVKGSTEGGFFGEGVGGETWEELFESGLSDSLGKGVGLGIADRIVEQFRDSVLRETLAPAAGSPAKENAENADPQGESDPERRRQ